MTKLLIIADDFTGALDTGVQFASRGAATCVIADADGDYARLRDKATVLVVNAETRHLPAEAAYQTVLHIVSVAREAGITFVYKKTDSALRGNIGSELAAVMDAAGEENLVFVPAFPQMSRVTKDGIHYIEGTPVAESVFGRDPFEPVRTSCIRDILAGQTDKPVVLHSSAEMTSMRPGIQIYDAVTDEDLRRIAAKLGPERLRLSAGCAAFAGVLADLLRLEGTPPAARLPDSLLVVCGSMNPVTIRQMDAAERAGYARVRLTPEQKLDPAWQGTPAGREMIRQWTEMAQREPMSILDVNSPAGEWPENCCEENGLTVQEARVRIAANLGHLIRHLLDNGLETPILCTGGDTLLALMQTIGTQELTPVCELAPGVVLAHFAYRDKIYTIISKSGGFGEADLLCHMAAEMKENRKKEKVPC